MKKIFKSFFFLFLVGATYINCSKFYGLVLGPYKIDKDILNRFSSEGIYLVEKDLSEPLNFERLKLFNFIILIPGGDLGTSSVPIFNPRDFVVKYFNYKRNCDEIYKYIENGGGLFFVQDMRGIGIETAEAYNEFLEKFGIKILAAQVRDDAHSVCDGEYSFTTNIMNSPITKGVKKIFYPTNMLRWDDAYSTTPFVIEDKSWVPVIKGMPESFSAKGLLYKQWFPISKEPVICAMRDYKKGKIVVIGISHFYFFTYPFSKTEWIGESNTGKIDGIFLEKGDGKEKSNGWELVLNILRYLGKEGENAGFGGYTEEKFSKIPPPESAEVPSWLTWDENTTKPFKVLIGVRSSYSDGKGTIKEFAEKAKKAGYSIIVMTETFEKFNPDKWEEFLKDCEKSSDNDIIVIPGIDIEDIYQNRYLLFGQKVFPQKFMLDEEGRRIKETQYLMLGFGTHFSAIHRPTTTPIPHQLYKFFSGIVVYTYRKGELIDNGLIPYQWHVNNTSMPIPLVVHEIYSPEEIDLATKGHQLFVYSDNIRNAAWYIRGGIQHFWEEPTLFLVSGGPIVKSLSHSKIVVESEVPLKEIRLIARYYPERIWRPEKEKRVSLNYYLPPTHFRIGFFYIIDEKGNTALTPPLRFGPTMRYTWRCSDRQNYFGWAFQYTGTILPDIDIYLPVFGTDEGKGFWPNQKKGGENLCPLLDFPFASKDVHITDAHIDQRYWKASWLDVAFDAKPANGTSPSRIYQGKVRYYDFNLIPLKRDDRVRPMMLKEVSITLKTPAVPESNIFPVFTSVSPKPEYGYYDEKSGKIIKGIVEKDFIDLPRGAYVDNLITFTPIRVDSTGKVGFPVLENLNGPLPVGTTWLAKYVKIEKKEEIEKYLNFMGFNRIFPYEINLKRGKIIERDFAVYLEANKYGVAGNIEAYKDAPYPIPLFIKGLNLNWDSGLWKEGKGIEYFGVFEGQGITKIDIKEGGKFYAGNLIIADNPDLRLSILSWKENEITIEANNPTEKNIETIIETPEEIVDKYRLKKTISVPPGSSIRITFREDKNK